MSEESKEPATKEAAPAQAAPTAQPAAKEFGAEDTAGARTACTVLLTIVALLFVRAFSVLLYHKSMSRANDPDAEGLYGLGVAVDWFVICICNAVVTGKSLTRLHRSVFYKVTMIIALLFWAAVVVLMAI